MAEQETSDRVTELTERLLREAGISAGMRVLDVGCGRGDLTFMAARLVGASGSVLGVDRDERALEAARARKRELAFEHVDFAAADVTAPPPGPYDAVIGRRVLMYVPDRVRAMRALAEVLVPGGLAVFQEVDATMLAATSGVHPLHERTKRWIWDTVIREGVTTSMGLELPSTFAAAGLELQRIRAEAIVQVAGRRHVTAAIVRAMLPRIVEHGVASEEEIQIETLEERLADELRHSDTAWIGDVVFGAWAKKPA